MQSHLILKTNLGDRYYFYPHLHILQHAEYSLFESLFLIHFWPIRVLLCAPGLPYPLDSVWVRPLGVTTGDWRVGAGNTSFSLSPFQPKGSKLPAVAGLWAPWHLLVPLALNTLPEIVSSLNCLHRSQLSVPSISCWNSDKLIFDLWTPCQRSCPLLHLLPSSKCYIFVCLEMSVWLYLKGADLTYKVTHFSGEHRLFRPFTVGTIFCSYIYIFMGISPLRGITTSYSPVCG